MPLIMPNRFYQPRGAFDPAPAGGSFALTYQDSKAVAAGASPLTYSGFTLAGGATRTVAVILYPSGATPGVTSVTIDGVACTQVSSAADGSNGNDAQSDIWISNSAVTGGTINVSVGYSSTPGYYSAVALYNLTTATTTAAGAAHRHEPFGAGPSTVGPVTIPSSGGAVFGANGNLGTAVTVTSGNATIDAAPTGGGNTFTFGHTTATGSQSVTVSYNGGGNEILSSTLAAWGP